MGSLGHRSLPHGAIAGGGVSHAHHVCPWRKGRGQWSPEPMCWGVGAGGLLNDSCGKASERPGSVLACSYCSPILFSFLI